jgi:hypothetical protein
MLLSQTSGIEYFVDIIIIYSRGLRTRNIFWTGAPSLPRFADMFLSSKYMRTSVSEDGQSSFSAMYFETYMIKFLFRIIWKIRF